MNIFLKNHSLSSVLSLGMLVHDHEVSGQRSDLDLIGVHPRQFLFILHHGEGLLDPSRGQGGCKPLNSLIVLFIELLIDLVKELLVEEDEDGVGKLLLEEFVVH